MMKTISNKEQQRVFAVDPMVRGFGFAILEGPDLLIDSGLREIRHEKNPTCLKRIREILENYELDGVIVEDYDGKGSKRCVRVQRLIRAIHHLAAKSNIATYSFSREEIRNAFFQFGAFNKHQIASVIADHLPQLAHQLPPLRKIWRREDDRMNIFDAASLALTFFYLQNKQKRAA